MRLATDGIDEQLAADTVAAATEAGITVFDTAHAYGRDGADLGGGERLLARALRRCGGAETARIVTKGGMARTDNAWLPDGRAKSILRDCEASLVALDGLPVDLYLIHTPDPRTPWRTSIRALVRLVEEGMVRRVGVSNVNRHQLDEALEQAPIAAVEVGLSLYDDRALRGGVLERCTELGLAVIAHSPLGGPRRALRLARLPTLVELGTAHDASPAEVALAWLLALSPTVVAIPGARRPDTARSAARAATLGLAPAEQAALAGAVNRRPSAVRRRRGVDLAPAAADADRDVVLVIGIPAAGKTWIAQRYVKLGYVRLNRDERGGGLRELADALDSELTRGTSRLVLDNTFLSRTARNYVIDVARRHAVPVRCVWLDTPLAQAQVNLVQRLLDLFGSLPAPEQVRALARRTQGVMLPTSQMRALRELEPPSRDEGFAGVEILSFARTAPDGQDRTGVFIAATALGRDGWEDAIEAAAPAAPHLVFDWNPDRPAEAIEPAVARVRAEASGPVQGALCPHGGGPPRCWCRPPLPGLPLAFARAQGVDPARSILIGAGPAHRTLATALGARYVQV